MRRLLLMALIVCLSTSTGCMVLDEVDAAAAKMPTTGKKKNKKKKKAQAEETAATATTSKQNALLEQSKEWWNRATSLAPGDVESSIVSCRLREGTQFMSKDDCLTRGGEPRSVSG